MTPLGADPDSLRGALRARLPADVVAALPDGAIDRLVAFGVLLLTHNRRANLVGPMDCARAADELLADSLELVPLLLAHGPAPDAAIDIGSGAGIPGIPLAIALPETRWMLVEPRQKRALFLEHARRTLDLPHVTVRRDRLEADTLPGLRAHGATLAVSRAVFAPDLWVERAAPLLGPDGRIAVWVNGSAPDHAAASRAYRTAGGAARAVALVAPGRAGVDG